MDLIESYIRNYQKQLIQKIHYATDTHLRITSFDIGSFNSHWHSAKYPFLQYMALEQLKNCSSITPERARETYQNWLNTPSLDKHITNQSVFPNAYFLFQHHILANIEARLPNIKSPCITKQIDNEYVAVEFEEKGTPRFGYN